MGETSSEAPWESCLAFITVAKKVVLFVAVCQMCQAIHKSRTMSKLKI